MATHLWDRCDNTGTQRGLTFKKGVVVTAQVHSMATHLWARCDSTGTQCGLTFKEGAVCIQCGHSPVGPL